MLRQAAVELLADDFFLEVFADEYELALSLLALFPQPIPQEREAVVDSVKDGATRVASDVEEPLLR